VKCTLTVYSPGRGAYSVKESLAMLLTTVITFVIAAMLAKKGENPPREPATAEKF